MKIRIVFNGVYVQVIDTETGRELANVLSVVFSADAQKGTLATITVVPEAVDVIADKVTVVVQNA